MPCCVMLCCEECPATDVHSVLRCVILTTKHGMLPQHPTGTMKLIISSVTLARNIYPDGGLRNETCRSVFNVLMCKFYICAVVGVIID